MNDTEEENTWLWLSDATPVTWFDWGKPADRNARWHEPTGGRIENCVVLKKRHLKTPSFADVPCVDHIYHTPRSVVCESECIVVMQPQYRFMYISLKRRWHAFALAFLGICVLQMLY